MKADVSSIIKIAGASVKLNGDIGLTEARFLGGTYKFDEPLKIDGEIYNNGQSLTLNASVSGNMITQCARCLKDIVVEIEFDIDEILSRAEDGAVDDGSEILFDGYEIDIDNIVYERFLMNISGRYLCKNDCKGLCPVCGHDLNEGDCGCETETIDPRWQALADIMKRQESE